MNLRLGAATLAWILLAQGAATQASVPLRERIEQAIGRANAVAGRAYPLKLDLVVQVGEDPALSRGELVLAPSGLARLELRHAGDNSVERYVRHGGYVMAARNGELLAEPRFFLPPLFVLQASDSKSLRAALGSFEVEPEPIGLAQCGEEDCLVLGDPGRDIPPIPGPSVAGLDQYEEVKAQLRAALELERSALGLVGDETGVGPEASESGESDGSLQTIFDPASNRDTDDTSMAGTLGGGGEDNGNPVPVMTETTASEAELNEEPQDPAVDPSLDPLTEAASVVPDPVAALWVTRQGYQIKGLDTVSGGRVRLGPLAAFEGLLVPSWILIEEPGEVPVRFEIRGAKRLKVPSDDFADDFGPRWLLEPNPGGVSAPSPPAPRL